MDGDIVKVGPGAYLEGDELHVYAPEVLDDLGIPDTPENRRIVEDAVREEFARRGGGQLVMASACTDCNGTGRIDLPVPVGVRLDAECWTCDGRGYVEDQP